jgi:hypothetical protein
MELKPQSESMHEMGIWGLTSIADAAIATNIRLGISEIKERSFPKWAMKLFEIQAFSIASPKFTDVLSKVADQDSDALRIFGRLSIGF